MNANINSSAVLQRIGLILVSMGLAGLLAACGGGNDSPPPAALQAAAITAQPTDQNAVAGTPATFSVTATNATGYQWQRSSNSGANFADVSGATATNYATAATTPTDSGAQYRVVVSCAGGNVTSSAATLTVTAAAVAPSITMQPADRTISAGQDASFSVTATGTALSYQWQHSTDGGATYTEEAGATAATLTLNAVAQLHNGHFLRVVVSNSLGSVTSTAALLTVNASTAAAAITQQPVSQSVTAPAAATFSAAASGTPAPTFQWQLDSGAGWGDISGATSASYTTPATALGDTGKQYRVMATNATGNVTSNIATLTVSAAATMPAITTQPVSVTITAGQNAQFTVAASGSPTPTYQWQLSADGGLNFNSITGATSAVFEVINAAQANNGRQFRAAVSNSAGSVNSTAATLTVLPPSNQMVTARLLHTATLLGNGKVIAVGGVLNGSSGGILNNTETFDPATLTWSTSKALGIARYSQSATLLANGKLLVVGGLGNNPGGAAIRLATVELYDPATNLWSMVGSLATARSHHSATLLANGKVLVAGGTSALANQLTASAELFDPATNSWSDAGSITVARNQHQSVLLPDGRVLVAGGGGNGSLASTELYDPATNSWSAGASMVRARNHSSLTLLAGGKVLAVGGWDQLGIGIVSSAELYDPVTNSWSAAGNLATGRYDHTATVLPDGQVLISAGLASTYLASAELYDPVTNAWSSTASLAIARYLHAATRLASGDILITGGTTTTSAPTARSEVYESNNAVWK